MSIKTDQLNQGSICSRWEKIYNVSEGEDILGDPGAVSRVGRKGRMQNVTIFQKKVRFLGLSESCSHTLNMLEQFLEQFIFHPDERQVFSNPSSAAKFNIYYIFLFI